MAYTVTLYNQAAGTKVEGKGRTKAQAFTSAIAFAGEEWLREGGDKLTTLRTLFADHIMAPYNRTCLHVHVSHPNGAGVEVRRFYGYVYSGRYPNKIKSVSTAGGAALVVTNRGDKWYVRPNKVLKVGNIRMPALGDCIHDLKLTGDYEITPA